MPCTTKAVFPYFLGVVPNIDTELSLCVPSWLSSSCIRWAVCNLQPSRSHILTANRSNSLPLWMLLHSNLQWIICSISITQAKKKKNLSSKSGTSSLLPLYQDLAAQFWLHVWLDNCSDGKLLFFKARFVHCTLQSWSYQQLNTETCSMEICIHLKQGRREKGFYFRGCILNSLWSSKANKKCPWCRLRVSEKGTVNSIKIWNQLY